jgi:hypothetical protein
MNIAVQLRKISHKALELADAYDRERLTDKSKPPSDPVLSIARNALWDTWTRDREARLKSSWQPTRGKHKPWTKTAFCLDNGVDPHDLRRFLRGELSPRSKRTLRIERALKQRADFSLGNKNDLPLLTANVR